MLPSPVVSSGRHTHLLGGAGLCSVHLRVEISNAVMCRRQIAALVVQLGISLIAPVPGLCQLRGEGLRLGGDVTSD